MQIGSIYIRGDLNSLFEVGDLVIDILLVTLKYICCGAAHSLAKFGFEGKIEWIRSFLD